MRYRTFLVCCVLGGIVASVQATDWTQFRGSQSNGHASDAHLPIVWGPDKNIAWKQAIPGQGWSSPIVRDGRVYLTAAIPAKEKDFTLAALCLDAGTGKIVWQTDVFEQDGKTAPSIHGKNSHASPTPLLRDGKLYVHFGHQGTACLDLNGKVIWRNRTLAYRPVHGNGGSPIVVDDLLVFSCDGGDTRFVAALDRATGELRWKTTRDWQVDRKFSFSTPQLIVVRGRKQIISPASDGVAAYDPADGKEIWRVRYEGYSVIPQPAYGHGMIFLSTSYNEPTLMAIRVDGAGDVTDTHIAWRKKKGAPHTPSPLLVGSELYVVSDNGLASCLDAKTGTEHWQERLGGNYSASPIFAEGHVYFQSEDGVGTVVAAGTKYEVLGKNALKERTLASFAVADGAIFARTDRNLYRIQSR